MTYEEQKEWEAKHVPPFNYGVNEILKKLPSVWDLDKLAFALRSNGYPEINSDEVIIIAERMTGSYLSFLDKPSTETQLNLALIKLKKRLDHLSKSQEMLGETSSRVAPCHCQDPFNEIQELIAIKLEEIIQFHDSFRASSRDLSNSLTARQYAVVIIALMDLGLIHKNFRHTTRQLSSVLAKNAGEIRKQSSRSDITKEDVESVKSFIENELFPTLDALI